MYAVTEMSTGIVLPSSCGISTVTALPPMRAFFSQSSKSNRSGCWLSAQAAPRPEIPPPTMHTRLGIRGQTTIYYVYASQQVRYWYLYIVVCPRTSSKFHGQILPWSSSRVTPRA